ncbi:CU044_5270 family protein [Streptomyces sp. 372A]
MTHENHPTDLLDFPGAAALERAGRTEPLDPAVQARAHSLVLEAIAADASAPVAAPRFGRRRVLALAAAVAAVAVGAAVLPVTGFGGDGPAASASASEVFTSMADHLTVSKGAHGGMITGQIRSSAYWKSTVESWVEGGKPRVDTRYLSHNSVTIMTADGRTFTKAIPGRASWPVGKGRVTWEGLAGLPTEPDALRRRLAAGSHGADDAAQQTVQQAGQLLTDAPLSPELRAAIFRVLAKTPGATVEEGAKDAKGRAGTRISWKWAKRFTEKNPKDWGFWPNYYVDSPKGADSPKGTDSPKGADSPKGTDTPTGFKLESAPALRPNWIVSPSDGRLLEVNHDPDDNAGHIVQRETYLSTGPAKTTG